MNIKSLLTSFAIASSLTGAITAGSASGAMAISQGPTPVTQQTTTAVQERPGNGSDVAMGWGVAVVFLAALLVVATRTNKSVRVGVSGVGGYGETGEPSNQRFLGNPKPAVGKTMPPGTPTTFNDVAGVPAAKASLQEIVRMLKEPQNYINLGAKLPKGVLLVSPPGTGKTLLARTVPHEAGVPFISISGSEFVEMFVGVGAKRVRELFERAKQHKACIIFIDEIDAVGKRRDRGPNGCNDEREQTLNQLLVEMDGIDPGQSTIIVIAATNLEATLDPALLRPGRFDRRVNVGTSVTSGSIRNSAGSF